MISLDGGRFTATTIRMIIYIFKNMFNGSWTTWNEVKRSARDELWGLFKAFFQWEVVADVLVREVWEDSMRRLYPGLMSTARDESIKMAQLAGVEFDGSDFSVLKPYNPEWIESSYWEDMIDRVWNTKSILWKHRGGSIAISQLKRRLGKELHISQTSAELFEVTHTNTGLRNKARGHLVAAAGAFGTEFLSEWIWVVYNAK
ncbi:hypothetical protein CTI12_AA167430 [Artemisia annua]|uniref:Uncharacterized protein n=1 Tax=Artemisia annua TaxID=35608 RepID=A0A2U1PCT5_ARTAN|nr:hypothetical protein CTI12_AA167430 [Artemisia annua]